MGSRRAYMAMVTAIIILNIFDVGNTLHILNYGGSEVNPIMDHFLSMGVAHFILAKFALVCGGLFIIYRHAPHFLKWGVLLYSGIVVYQFWILFFAGG